LLLAFSLLYPKQKILLFFVIPIQAKWLALLFGGLEFLLSFRNDGISHIGHLGGILAGLGYFIYMKKSSFAKGTMNDQI
jgi:membrane associated rhomboid family serine protease